MSKENIKGTSVEKEKEKIEELQQLCRELFLLSYFFSIGQLNSRSI